MLTGQQPGPSHVCSPPGGLAHLQSFSGGGVLPGLGPRSPTEFAQRVLLPQTPTQGQGRAGAWQAFAGEMEERVWWGPGPMERSQGPSGKLLWPGGLVVTASSSRRGDRWGPGSPRTTRGESSPPWGPGHPVPPRRVLVLLSQDSAQSPCPEAAIRGQGHSGLGLTECRWEGPAIRMKSSHVRSNPHPAVSPPPSPPRPPGRALTRVLAWGDHLHSRLFPLGASQEAPW